MEQPQKKALIVNLSSLHDLNSYFSVLKKIAELSDNYPCNVPPLTKDFFMGKYQQIIDDYKMGKITSDDEFAEALIKKSGLNIEDVESFKKAWNTLVEFNEKPHSYCCGLWKTQGVPTIEKFQCLINYVEENNIDQIYLVSNSNPLNVKKIVKYLNKNFSTEVIPYFESQGLNTQEVEEASSVSSCNIKISSKDSTSNIYLAVSYKYGVFKASHQVNNKTTPGLLAQLVEQLKKEHTAIVGVISQFKPDLAEAKKLGIEEKNIFLAKSFYQKHLYQVTSEPKNTKKNN